MCIVYTMGAYLSEPMTEKSSSDESNDFVVCGLSSMQGWRVTQEDAHNSVLDFDEGTSLFAVYDGHGGHEVAAYCSQNLPKYIKESEAYKNGDFIESLKEAFLGFDATLTKPEIIGILKEIAGNKEEDGSGSDDDENVNNLYEEAEMPIEQVIAKYQSDAANPAIRKLQSPDGKTPPSPFLKGRGVGSSSGAGSSGAGCSSSSDGSSASGSSVGCSSSSAGSSSSDQVSSSSSQEAAGSSSSNSVQADAPDTQSASPDVGSSGDHKAKEEERNCEDDVCSGSGDCTSKHNGDVDSTVKKELNGDINHDVNEVSETPAKSEAVSSSCSPCNESMVKNGAISSEDDASKEGRVKGKGKAKDKSPRPDPSEAAVDSADKAKPEPRKTRVSTIQLYRKLVKMSDAQDEDDSDETEDEEDTTFDGGNVNSSDEEGDEMEDDDDEDDDDEDEDEDDSMDEDDDEDDEDCEDDMGMKLTDEPGSDSGCTAVVALLKGRDLYVANAGDSRCVVCRGGKAIDMSLDHKPEDQPEFSRILNAGGRVTQEGRVNGGLNLSRAIGDHAYKQAKELPATEQMIIALPDVRTLRIDPDQDEFMVLACDGIWNFLTSQEVVDFVRTRIKDGKLKVSQICEELFDHCLAPNTLGDGTGCDNMTAVIVKFQPELAKAPCTLSHDSVFDVEISNDSAEDKEEKAEANAVAGDGDDDAEAEAEAEAEAKVKAAVEAEAEVKAAVEAPVDTKAEVKADSCNTTGEEVTTSNSLKRSAPSSAGDGDNSVDSPQPQDKRPKTENSESASLDSEAVAVEV